MINNTRPLMLCGDIRKEAGFLGAANKAYKGMSNNERAAVHAIGNYAGGKLLDKVRDTSTYKRMTKREKRAAISLGSYARDKLVTRAKSMQ